MVSDATHAAVRTELVSQANEARRRAEAAGREASSLREENERMRAGIKRAQVWLAEPEPMIAPALRALARAGSDEEER